MTADSSLDHDEHTSTLTLPDGRSLGYAQYGALNGSPILLNHGMACSRLDAALFHDTASQLNIRLIGIDRPGMGLSTHQPNRTLRDFADDVKVLTEHLGLEEYRIMGISGGGPSTLTLARYLPPTKLLAISMVVALGPPDIGISGTQLANRIGYSSYGLRYCPSFLNRWFWRQQIIGRVDLSDEERLARILSDVERRRLEGGILECERDAMDDISYHRSYLGSTREGFRQGYDGVLVDGRLCCLPFGFGAEEIAESVNVDLWYASNDRFVPANHGVVMKERLGERACLHLLEGETHVSLTYKYGREILESLLRAGEGVTGGGDGA